MKLTRSDWALCDMVALLTGRPCEPKAGDNHYFFTANYKGFDAEEICALYDFICFTAGRRLLGITDDPDYHRLVVKVKFFAKG